MQRHHTMSLELVAGPLMEAVFSVLLERIASDIFNFFKKNKSDKFLKRMKIILLSIHAVLNDAEEKKIRNEAVKEWLEELKDVAFDADDLLDEIYTVEKIKAKEVNTIHSTPSNLCDGKDLEQKLQDIAGRLENIINQKEVLDLKVGKEVKMAHKIPTSSVIEECDVYGRDNDREILVNLLLTNDANDEKLLGVIPIKEFDLKVWIYVSEEFDICKITKNLLEVVTSCKCDIEDLNSLQRNLKMHLLKKKFLFVLDDVWNENYDNWDKFRTPFKHAGAHRSKIIVTTRSGHVASIMQTLPPYYLSELSYAYCWDLFSKHAFDYGDSNVHQSLEKVGRDIVRKCNGLPLAVKTLAGLLRSKSERQEWHKVLNSEIWDLQDHESKGLLHQSKRHGRIEEAGHEYFCELVSRSFFQQSRRDKSCYLLHHLVNDLAQYVSGTFSVRIEGNNSHQVEERTRHLSHVISHSSSYVNLTDVSKANRLHTFMQIRTIGTSIDMFNNMPNDLLTKLRCLRELSLVGAYFYSLPDSIGELKHLRYPEVSYTEIMRLPESICRLHNLQTLKLVGCYKLSELPTEIHKLVNLRYLDIRDTCLKWMPLQISELTNLQGLSDFFVGNDYGSSIGELGELSTLHGTLSIHYIEHVANSKESEKAKLKEKHCLEMLSLDWGGSGDTDNSEHEKTILHSLPPHTNLKKLSIYDYPGTEFSDWLGDYSYCNLVYLQLKGCKYCYKLPPVGQLPMFKELHIIKFEGLVNVGSEFYGNRTSATESFPALEILRTESMTALEEWCSDADIAGSRGFSHLREFYIEECPKLRGDLPRNLPSLTLLVIRDCKRLLCSLPKSPTLWVLNIQNCEKLQFPVLETWYHQSLTSLFLLDSCDSLMLLPLDLFPNLKSLDIWRCKNLEALTVSTSDSDATPPKFKSLHSLCIRHCPKFLSFPKGGFAAPKLVGRLYSTNIFESVLMINRQSETKQQRVEERDEVELS
ncbi:hypothetical protein OROGR_001451 [Orobanche gracilis]